MESNTKIEYSTNKATAEASFAVFGCSKYDLWKTAELSISNQYLYSFSTMINSSITSKMQNLTTFFLVFSA